MKTVKIQYDDNQIDVVEKINGLLSDHGLSIEFMNPETPKDGYEEIFVKINTKEPEVAQMVPKIKNVFKDANGYKFVVNDNNISDILNNPNKYTFVCEKPHGDGDFSYICWSDWCRCMQ